MEKKRHKKTWHILICWMIGIPPRLDCNDHACSCPRGRCFSAITGVQLRTLLKPLKHHGTMVSRGFKEALNSAPIILNGVGLSDSWCHFLTAFFLFFFTFLFIFFSQGKCRIFIPQSEEFWHKKNDPSDLWLQSYSKLTHFHTRSILTKIVLVVPLPKYCV